MSVRTHSLQPNPSTSLGVPQPWPRRWAGLLALFIAVPSVMAVPLGVLWPEPASGDWYAYGDIAPIRDTWWWLVVTLSVGAVLCVPAQAIATLLLARRSAAWTTTGAVLMWLGTALQAVGVGGWAATYYFATDTVVDKQAGTAWLDHIAGDPRMFALAIPGSILVALGTSCQAIGLLRARTVPVWIPLCSLAVVPTFVMPSNGPLGLLINIPISASAVAIGWYVWRRANDSGSARQ